VLGKLARQHDPNVLVGFETADDAGVYKISPELALVQTVDFFTPIVDDPHTFGQIAAVNALSDVYAMGGRPVSSLAMVCFPDKGDLEVLGQILAGGLSKMIEAGCTVIGGHSIRDEEIKFGYSLVLTKALGTGVISTALKQGKAQPAWIATATKSMTTLNKLGAEVASEFPGDVHGATDITGFGLVGHIREMALASHVGVRIDSAKLPLLDGAIECVRAGCVPQGLKSNREFAECIVEYGPGVDDPTKAILFDPQTAGGLLLSISANKAEGFVRAFQARGGDATIIGEVLSQTDPLIMIV
jgi:selenide, water dikinase